MHLDVADLRRFYYRTPLGRVAQSALQRALLKLWPDVKGETIVGFGFAAPVLRPFLADARRVICLMPAAQGVARWPADQPNRAALVEETLWPLPDGYADRLLVAHGIETCERPAALFEEIWRVLAPGGSVVLIAPNRSGLWARRDVTPFGYGRPYSIRQLERQLGEHRFEPTRHAACLYAPPSHKRFWLRFSGLCENVGLRLDLKRAAGVILIEATKLVYAAPKSGARASVKGPLEVLEGLTAPKPRPIAGRAARSEAARLMLSKPARTR